MPDDWTENRFKALLVAIAIRQSNLGYPDPGGEYDPTWIMEYGWADGKRQEKYAGVDNQIKGASLILKLALERKIVIFPYDGCRKPLIPFITPNAHLKCVLSVYYTGETSRFFGKNEGKSYAKETIEIMEVAEEYFS